MKASERRSAQLVLRITQAERKTLEAGAHKAGLKLAEYVRRLLTEGGH